MGRNICLFLFAELNSSCSYYWFVFWAKVTLHDWIAEASTFEILTCQYNSAIIKLWIYLIYSYDSYVLVFVPNNCHIIITWNKLMHCNTDRRRFSIRQLTKNCWFPQGVDHKIKWTSFFCLALALSLAFFGG